MALNIEEYNTQELMEIIHLDPNTIYTEDEICMKYLKVVMNVQNDADMEKSEKENIVGFLNSVLSKLLALNSTKKIDAIKKERNLEKLPLLYGVGNPRLSKRAEADERGETYKLMNSHRNVDLNNSENKVFNPPKVYEYQPEAMVQSYKDLKGDNINNFNIKKTNKILKINSLFRSDYYNSSSSDFMITLPQSLNNIMGIRLTGVEIINNIYNISSKNRTNEFTVELYDLVSKDGQPIGESNFDISNNKIITVELRDGVYDERSLIDYLNRHVFSYGDIGRIGVTYDDITKKITFIRDEREISNGGIPDTATHAYRFNIDWRLKDDTNRPIQLNLGWKLGFRKQYYSYDENYLKKSDIKPGATEGYNGECGCDLKGSKYFLLSINDFNNNSGETIIAPYQDSLFKDTNILAHIPWSDESVIKLHSGDELHVYERQYFGPVDITRMHIRLLDEFGRIVDLNNNDFSFSIILDQAYNHKQE